jgi:hypothetical protein
VCVCVGVCVLVCVCVCVCARARACVCAGALKGDFTRKGKRTVGGILAGMMGLLLGTQTCLG